MPITRHTSSAAVVAATTLAATALAATTLAATAVAATALAGCTQADARPAREAAPATARSAVAAPTLAAAPAGAIRFTVTTTGNAARYRVRERLMGRDLDNDAVGETQQVAGAITVDEAGKVLADQSRFVVTTAGLKSDNDRRDGYVRRRLLETEQFPTVELVPTVVRGFPAKLPAAGAAAGPVSFELLGNLTVKGVTRPTTWRVTARQAGNTVTGTATTRFTFTDFGITPPKVPVVLSVADTIGLEYDFTLTRAPAEQP
jgi:polyisoprenoid-binding protein YceI